MWPIGVSSLRQKSSRAALYGPRITSGLAGPDHANWPLTRLRLQPKWLGRMNIPIDRKSPVPLARQIQAQLERLIREGVLAPGLKLPASRDLAATLGGNR